MRWIKKKNSIIKFCNLIDLPELYDYLRYLKLKNHSKASSQQEPAL